MADAYMALDQQFTRAVQARLMAVVEAELKRMVPEAKLVGIKTQVYPVDPWGRVGVALVFEDGPLAAGLVPMERSDGR